MQVLKVQVQLMMKRATIVTFSKFGLCDLEQQGDLEQQSDLEQQGDLEQQVKSKTHVNAKPRNRSDRNLVCEVI
jgi:hypothetical protein